MRAAPADLLKATPMDRPEDVETNPVNGRVYVMLTNNSQRSRAAGRQAANPRRRNDHGHVIEITPKDGDHASTEGTWSIFLVGGKPGIDRGRALPSRDDGEWLAVVPRQLRLRQQGPHLDRDRRRADGGRHRRRALWRRHRRATAAR